MDIENKVKQALLDHDNGFNCAQSVIRQFAEDFGLLKETATLIASGFGGGMSCGRTCGALTGAIMVLGLATGYFNPEDLELKDRHKALVASFIKEFDAAHGNINCYDLIGLDLSIPGNRDKAIEQGLFDARCPNYIAHCVLGVDKIIKEHS